MLRLGLSVKDNSPVQLSLDERRQGMYIIGTTGTGKSNAAPEYHLPGYAPGPYPRPVRA
jgi:hypothetical protein